MKRIVIVSIYVSFNLFSQSTKNDSIVSYVKKNGALIAPTYESMVCTSFLVKVLQHFTSIDKSSFNKIQIITKLSIHDLITKRSEIPNGVCYALNSSGKGKYVDLKEAKKGDFVQFWNSYLGIYNTGHCGILDHIDYTDNTIYMYSSHPQTNGFGLHVFDMPDYISVARLL